MAGAPTDDLTIAAAIDKTPRASARGVCHRGRDVSLGNRVERQLDLLRRRGLSGDRSSPRRWVFDHAEQVRRLIFEVKGLDRRAIAARATASNQDRFGADTPWQCIGERVAQQPSYLLGVARDERMAQ
jgi:hypothetical protein